jgi:hypothetical protein
MANNKKVEVVVRLRPLVNEEENCVEVIDCNTVDIINFRNSDEHLRYRFVSPSCNVNEATGHA